MKKLLLIPLFGLLLAGCTRPEEPIGSALEAPGASRMPDPPKRNRPEVPGLNRGAGDLGNK